MQTKIVRALNKSIILLKLSDMIIHLYGLTKTKYLNLFNAQYNKS